MLTLISDLEYGVLATAPHSISIWAKGTKPPPNGKVPPPPRFRRPLRTLQAIVLNHQYPTAISITRSAVLNSGFRGTWVNRNFHRLAMTISCQTWHDPWSQIDTNFYLSHFSFYCCPSKNQSWLAVQWEVGISCCNATIPQSVMWGELLRRPELVAWTKHTLGN